MNSEAILARPKSNPPPADPEGPRPIAIAVRGLPAWKQWAERLKEHAAKKLGVPLSLNALVGLSMAHYAKSIGFKEEPPER
jgi:hypothetical protein